MEQNVADIIKALSDRQQVADRKLSELNDVVKALQFKIAELSHPVLMAVATEPKKLIPAAPSKSARAEVTPEILVMLAAAATSYLGKRVRVRTAKMLQSPYEVINPWSQQGRASIQASHHTLLRR